MVVAHANGHGGVPPSLHHSPLALEGGSALYRCPVLSVQARQHRPAGHGVGRRRNTALLRVAEAFGLRRLGIGAAGSDRSSRRPRHVGRTYTFQERGVQTAHSVPNWSKHFIFPRGYHTVYWADDLVRFAIACGWLYPALRCQGDIAKANEVKVRLLKATDVLLSLQLPWNGVFVDDEGNEQCQPDVAGGLFSAYRMVGGAPRSCRYRSRLEEVATAAGSLSRTPRVSKDWCRAPTHLTTS